MIQFELYGPPRPQKQTRRGDHGLFYNPSSKEQEQIQWEARPHAPNQPFGCPVHLDLTFIFTPSLGTSGIRKRQMISGVIHHIKRPDIDNLAYLVTNSLKSLFYVDDSQITEMRLSKRYGETAKTIVKIIPLTVGGVDEDHQGEDR